MAQPLPEPPTPEVISMALMADPVALSVVRQRFREWLAGLCWPDEEIDDIVLAVNEAVSNAVENSDVSGFAAEVRVAARQFNEADGGRRVIVGVSDNRRWCSTPSQRGLGLVMMHTCMDDVQLDRNHEATTVVMTSVRVPPVRGWGA